MKARTLTPYCVSADKIGALAMRSALVLSAVAEVEQTRLDQVDGKTIECYPSAALYRFGFNRAELRHAKTDSSVRKRLLEGVLARTRWLEIDAATPRGMNGASRQPPMWDISTRSRAGVSAVRISE